MRLPKFRCKNKIGNWFFFTVLHNGNVNEENFDLETLSQFTGLKDKNGVEIYEGDIVTIKEDERKFYLKWFDNMCFDFADVRSDYIRTFYDCYDTLDGFPLEEWIEVIGNIYENKELLNA